MTTCPAQPVTFWNVFFQHQGHESRVPVTFSHILDGLPGIRLLSFQPVCCMALNYSSLQTTPVAYPDLGGSGRRVLLGRYGTVGGHSPSIIGSAGPLPFLRKKQSESGFLLPLPSLLSWAWAARRLSWQREAERRCAEGWRCMSPQRLLCSCPTPRALEGTENPPSCSPPPGPFPGLSLPLPHRLTSIRKGLPSWILESYLPHSTLLSTAVLSDIISFPAYLWRPLYWKPCLLGWGLEGAGNQGRRELGRSKVRNLKG